MKSKLTLLLVFTYSLLSGQSFLDPDNILVGANQFPTQTSSDSIFYFYKPQMSWRAGEFSNGNAQTSNIGGWSGLWGKDNLASADFASSWGLRNQVSGTFSSVFGDNNTITGDYSTAWGASNNVAKNYTTARGLDNFINCSYATIWGVNNVLNGLHLTAWGENNNSSGNYNTIWGNQNSTSDSLTTSWGLLNEASGSLSTVWGATNKVNGRVSTAWGGETQANHRASTSWGHTTVTDSSGATAWGLLNKSLNDQATSWGRYNQALGINATVMGEGNGTRNANSFVVGQFNEFSEGGLSGPSVNPGDTIFINQYGDVFITEDYHQLFVVGNGDGSYQRSNAITVTRRGRMGVGVSVPSSRLHIAKNEKIQLGNQAFLTGDGLVIETNAAIIPAVDSIGDLGSNSKRWQRVYTSFGVVTTSDIRLKENIVPVNKGLSKIENISPINYNFIDNPEERVIGFSAQALEDILPEVVHKDKYFKKDGHTDYNYGVNYDEIIPILTRAIQEQQAILRKSTVEKERIQLEIMACRAEIIEISESLNSK